MTGFCLVLLFGRCTSPSLRSYNLRMQSISLGGSPRRSSAQPICDVAYNPEEIKARLSGVPVYTVANKQNEFILVAGEVGGHLSTCPPVPQRRCWQLTTLCMLHLENAMSWSTWCHVQSGEQVKQLGLIFMSEDDANALVEKVCQTSLLSPSHSPLCTCELPPRQQYMPQQALPSARPVFATGRAVATLQTHSFQESAFAYLHRSILRRMCPVSQTNHPDTEALTDATACAPLHVFYTCALRSATAPDWACINCKAVRCR